MQDNYDIDMHFCSAEGPAIYMKDYWVDGIMFKSEIILESIKKYWGEVFLYSDVDVQFFRPAKEILLKAIENHDIACQADDPYGLLCSGFWIGRANRRVLRLQENMRKCILKERRDQIAFNRILKVGRMDKILYSVANLSGSCRYTSLPTTFFGGGTFTAKQWHPGDELPVPENPVMHHANYTKGVDSKIAQLKYVRDIVESRRSQSR
jgi:hypothetical protein